MIFNDAVFHKFPVIKTDRLILREILDSDKNEIFEIYSDHNVMKYFGSIPFSAINEAVDRISLTGNGFKNKEGIRWGITVYPENKLAGSAGIWRIDKKNFRGEIGYELSKNHWRKGIMKEALIEIINFAFVKMNLHTLEANTDPLNNASNKLLESLGFVKEGQTTESFFFEDKFSDTAIFSLTKNKFMNII